MYSTILPGSKENVLEPQHTISFMYTSINKLTVHVAPSKYVYCGLVEFAHKMQMTGWVIIGIIRSYFDLVCSLVEAGCGVCED